MKVFTMFILIWQMDVTGDVYTTPMVESPRQEYVTYEECSLAADIKRKEMLLSSLKYPELEIFEVSIECRSDIESKEDWHPGDLTIPI